VPLLVHSAPGVCVAAIFNPMRPENGESPATRPTVRSSVSCSQQSPPFSTITGADSFASARPPASATAPATAASGPTPAAWPARSIALTNGGAKGSAGSGISAVANSGCCAM